MKHSYLTLLPRIALFALVYFILGFFSLIGSGLSRVSGVLWPPTGVSFLVVLLFGPELWPGILIGSIFLNQYYVDSPLWVSVGVGIASSVGTLVGYYFFQTFFKINRALNSSRDVLAFIASTLIFSSPLTAVIGIGSIALAGEISWSAAGSYVGKWWIENSMSTLILVPLVLSWIYQPKIQWSLIKKVEALVVSVFMLLFLGLLFDFIKINHFVFYLNQPYLLLLFVMWVAFRFSPREVVTANFIISLSALIATLQGRGPFILENQFSSLFFLQSFMLFITSASLVFGAMAHELKEAVIGQAKLYCQAEEAKQSRERFLSIASHELKTPITTLNIFFQIFKNNFKEAPDKRTEVLLTSNFFNTADQQLTRLCFLIDQLFDVSQINAGKLTLERKPINLGDLIQRCVNIQNMKLSIASDVIGNWDPIKIEQVISNLVSNAVKYGEGNPISAELTKQQSRAVFKVKDQGLGIAKEDQDRIFECYERVDDQKPIGGLGLGLFIVRQIIEAHGGCISVNSELGKGSTFVVELPLA